MILMLTITDVENWNSRHHIIVIDWSQERCRVAELNTTPATTEESGAQGFRSSGIPELKRLGWLCMDSDIAFFLYSDILRDSGIAHSINCYCNLFVLNQPPHHWHMSQENTLNWLGSFTHWNHAHRNSNSLTRCRAKTRQKFQLEGASTITRL